MKSGDDAKRVSKFVCGEFHVITIWLQAGNVEVDGLAKLGGKGHSVDEIIRKKPKQIWQD